MTAASAPIICGVDFSTDAQRALQCAATLAVRLERPLLLVSAVEPLLAEAATLRGAFDAFADQVRKDLRDQAASLSTGVSAGVHVEAGEAAPVLLRAASAAASPLVVVGTRGLGHAARWFLGSTTIRLLRSTDRPILAVPASDDDAAGPVTAWPPIARLCCGVDFSDGSLAAVEAAARLASDLGASLTLVHAVPAVSVPVGWEEAVRAADVDRLRQAETHLQDVARKMCKGASIRAALGTPANVLAEEAGEDPATIIAVGLRGAGHHRPGSTAMRVLSTARVPVLAVPE